MGNYRVAPWTGGVQVQWAPPGRSVPARSLPGPWMAEIGSGGTQGLASFRANESHQTNETAVSGISIADWAAAAFTIRALPRSCNIR